MHSGVIELKCEDVAGYDSPLSHQLMQAMVCNNAVTLGIAVHIMIVTGRPAVNGLPKMDRLPVGRRAEHKMQVAGVEMKDDSYLLRQVIIPAQGQDSMLKNAIGRDWKGKLLTVRKINFCQGNARCEANPVRFDARRS